MAKSIQIEEETWNELVKIKGDLLKKKRPKKGRISFDSVIKFLLKVYYGKAKRIR